MIGVAASARRGSPSGLPPVSFTGDDVLDRLRFDVGGGRYFRIFDSCTSATLQSRHQM
jgi:hypothetical protein